MVLLIRVLTCKGYAAVLKRVQHSCSKNPWHRGAVMALEGGYNPNVSANCAAACVKIAMVEDTHRSELPDFDLPAGYFEFCCEAHLLI